MLRTRWERIVFVGGLVTAVVLGLGLATWGFWR